jgi:hypothetical protein
VKEKVNDVLQASKAFLGRRKLWSLLAGSILTNARGKNSIDFEFLSAKCPSLEWTFSKWNWDVLAIPVFLSALVHSYLIIL